MNQFARLNMSNLNEAWLERENVRIAQCKRCRCPFPLDLPVLSGPPAIAIDEEAEVRIIEEEIGV